MSTQEVPPVVKHIFSLWAIIVLVILAAVVLGYCDGPEAAELQAVEWNLPGNVSCDGAMHVYYFPIAWLAGYPYTPGPATIPRGTIYIQSSNVRVWSNAPIWYSLQRARDWMMVAIVSNNGAAPGLPSVGAADFYPNAIRMDATDSLLVEIQCAPGASVSIGNTLRYTTVAP